MARKNPLRALPLIPLLVLAAAAALAVPAAAVEVEVTPTVAYRSDDYGCRSGDVVIAFDPQIFPPPTCSFFSAESNDGPAFGAVLGFGNGRDWQLELLASRQETELDLAFAPNVQVLAGDVENFVPPSQPDFTVSHLQLGVARTWGGGVVRPFASVAVGASRVEADDPEQRLLEFEDDAFSASFGTGVKVFFSERVGLRLEGRGYWVDLESEAGGDFTQTEAATGLILRF